MANYRISEDAEADLRRIYRRGVCGVDSIYYRLAGETVEFMCILGQQHIDDWI